LEIIVVVVVVVVVIVKYTPPGGRGMGMENYPPIRRIIGDTIIFRRPGRWG